MAVLLKHLFPSCSSHVCRNYSSSLRTTVRYFDILIMVFSYKIANRLPMEHFRNFSFLLSSLWSQKCLQKQFFLLKKIISSISLTPFRWLRDQFSDDFSAVDLLSVPAWCWYYCSINWAMTVIKVSVFSPECSRLLCRWQQGKESLQECFFGDLLLTAKI